MLALLSLAPDLSRRRLWLQDKLWSAREAQQGGASLRQALAEIRRSLGAERDALIARDSTVALDRSAFSIDIDDLPGALARWPRWAGEPTLLDGMDIADEEFEDWLRISRVAFSEQVVALESVAAPVPVRVVPSADRLPALLVVESTDIPAGGEVGSWLSHSIASGIADHVNVETVLSESTSLPEELSSTAGLVLRVSAMPSSEQYALRVSLYAENGLSLLWSQARTASPIAGDVVQDPTVQQLCNHAIDAATAIYAKRAFGEEPEHAANRLVAEASALMFRLGTDDVEKAERLLIRAYDFAPRGVHLAWRAFLRTIQLGEGHQKDLHVLREEADALISQALQADPFSSNVNALAAHVNHLILGNVDAATMLARTSLDINPANPLAHAHLETALATSGEHEAGYRHALTGLSIAGCGPYRYQIMMDCCLTAILHGKYREALYYAQCSHALAPTYLPPLRYMVALHLYTNNEEMASSSVAKLRRLERLSR